MYLLPPPPECEDTVLGPEACGGYHSVLHHTTRPPRPPPSVRHSMLHCTPPPAECERGVGA